MKETDRKRDTMAKKNASTFGENTKNAESQHKLAMGTMFGNMQCVHSKQVRPKYTVLTNSMLYQVWSLGLQETDKAK